MTLTTMSLERKDVLLTPSHIMIEIYSHRWPLERPEITFFMSRKWKTEMEEKNRIVFLFYSIPFLCLHPPHSLLSVLSVERICVVFFSFCITSSGSVVFLLTCSASTKMMIPSVHQVLGCCIVVNSLRDIFCQSWDMPSSHTRGYSPVGIKRWKWNSFFFVLSFFLFLGWKH